MRQQKALKTLRDERGVSRAELAVAVGTTYSMITRIEQGQQEPKLTLARRIAEYFSVAVEDIAWPEVAPKKAARAAA
jgi:putative transcriptional regulator